MKLRVSIHKYWKDLLKRPSLLFLDWNKKEGAYLNILLNKNIKKNSTILDVGCGFGKDIKIIANRAKEIVGIDWDKGAIEEAKRNLSKFKNVKLLVQDAKKMEFRDRMFDYVICMGNTFGNFGIDKLKILKEMKRVLKNEGKIIIGIYSDKALSIKIENYKRANIKIKKIRKDGTLVMDGWTSEQFSKEKLSNIFRKVNLKFKIIDLNPISYICEAKR